MHPKNKPTQPQSRFWDQLAEKYARQPVKDQDAYQYKLSKTRQYLNPDMNVLEIGCGTGTTALLHAPLVKHIHAIDFSKPMIDIARKKAHNNSVHNILFEHRSIHDLNTNSRYHAIMAHSILHLIPDKDTTIATLATMLNPGGAFISSTVCIADSFPLLGLVAPLGKMLGILPIISSFKQTNLLNAFENANLNIDHIWKPHNKKATFIVALKPKKYPNNITAQAKDPNNDPTNPQGLSALLE